MPVVQHLCRADVSSVAETWEEDSEEEEGGGGGEHASSTYPCCKYIKADTFSRLLFFELVERPAFFVPPPTIGCFSCL